MKWEMQVSGMSELSETLSQLEDDAPAVAARALYKGERILEYRGERWSIIRTDPYKEFNGVILLIRRTNDESVVGGNA